VARDPEHLVVGQLSKPHGTGGELMVWPLTDRPEEIFVAGRRLLLGTAAGNLEEPVEEVEVVEGRPYRKGFLVRLAGVEDRSGAEALVTRYVLMRTDELGEPEPDEVYYHHLLGMEVELADGTVVGRVREVYETVPHHLLEVKAADRVHLIPFAREVVRTVDVEGRRLVIEPPQGLLEL
jgi:16S rRNA processing protein RimM